MAAALRQGSEARKRAGTASVADVDADAAAAWLTAADATVLIHGHTHRPGEHELPGGGRRIVLTDWDAAANPARLEVLAIAADGAVRRVPPA